MGVLKTKPLSIFSYLCDHGCGDSDCVIYSTSENSTSSYCDLCEKVLKCHKCKSKRAKYIVKDEDTDKVIGIFCNSCYVKLFTKCIYCDATEYNKEKKFHWIKFVKGYICDYHYNISNKCSVCGCATLNDYFYLDKKYYCQECGVKEYYYCNLCNSYHKLGTVCPNPFCPRVIKYNPLKKFFGNDSYYLGIEHEVGFDYENNLCCKLEDIIKCDDDNRIYVKDDLSIEHGFEIVTQPMSFQYIKDNKNFFEEYFSYIDEIPNDANCGIHIHISRTAFINKLHLFKFIEFFRKNEKFIIKFSDRELYNFKEWSKIDKKGSYLKKLINPILNEYDKSMAVNISHPDTIEIRIFNTTNNISTFYSYIEFVVALTEFTKNTQLNNLKEKLFRRFISNNESEYPNLKKKLDL